MQYLSISKNTKVKYVNAPHSTDRYLPIFLCTIGSALCFTLFLHGGVLPHTGALPANNALPLWGTALIGIGLGFLSICVIAHLLISAKKVINAEYNADNAIGKNGELEHNIMLKQRKNDSSAALGIFAFELSLFASSFTTYVILAFISHYKMDSGLDASGLLIAEAVFIAIICSGITAGICSSLYFRHKSESDIAIIDNASAIPANQSEEKNR